MSKVVIMTLALFAASLLLSGLVFAGKIATLQPGKVNIDELRQAVRELRHEVQATREDLLKRRPLHP